MSAIVHFPCAGLLDEPSFSPQEKLQILSFQREVARRLEAHSHSHTDTHTDPHTHTQCLEQLSMFSLAQTLSLDLTALPKDSLFMVALWVSLLSQLSRVLPLQSLKYPTMASFREAYPARFDDEPLAEQERLWHSANWFCMLFRFVSAKKNKGLAMQVVPKLVQGWEAKYVTGSGQTRLTAHRVALFEREGDVLPCQRGRARKHAHTTGHHASSSSSSSSAVERAFLRAKKRRRRSNTARSSHTHARAETKREREESEREWVYNYHYGSEEMHCEEEFERERESFEDEFCPEGEEENELCSLERAKERERESFTDADEDSVENENDEIKSVFFSFISKPSLQRDESLQYPAHLELLRSQALLCCEGESEGHAFAATQREYAVLRSPMRAPPLARGVSWTEIPVNNNHYNCYNLDHISHVISHNDIAERSSSSASLLEFFGNTDTVIGQQIDASQLQTLFYG